MKISKSKIVEYTAIIIIGIEVFIYFYLIVQKEKLSKIIEDVFDLKFSILFSYIIAILLLYFTTQIPMGKMQKLEQRALFGILLLLIYDLILFFIPAPLPLICN